MFEQTKVEVVEKGMLKKAVHVGGQIAQAGFEAARVKDKLSHAVEDGVSATKRAIKHSRYAAQDFVGETAHHIKRDPLRSVAITFGMGLGIGVVIGWLAKRKACKD